MKIILVDLKRPRSNLSVTLGFDLNRKILKDIYNNVQYLYHLYKKHRPFKANLPGFSSIGMDPDPKLSFVHRSSLPKTLRVRHDLSADPQ